MLTWWKLITVNQWIEAIFTRMAYMWLVSISFSCKETYKLHHLITTCITTGVLYKYFHLVTVLLPAILVKLYSRPMALVGPTPLLHYIFFVVLTHNTYCMTECNVGGSAWTHLELPGSLVVWLITALVVLELCEYQEVSEPWPPRHRHVLVDLSRLDQLPPLYRRPHRCPLHRLYRLNTVEHNSRTERRLSLVFVMCCGNQMIDDVRCFICHVVLHLFVSQSMQSMAGWRPLPRLEQTRIKITKGDQFFRSWINKIKWLLVIYFQYMNWYEWETDQSNYLRREI